VFYESPYRIEKLLGELNEVFPEPRRWCWRAELTKKFEEFLRGKPAELLLKSRKNASLKGEFVVLVADDAGRKNWPALAVGSGG
jgi:16S rRNA (cytidine1402-2'-O)-methyltransferase